MNVDININLESFNLFFIRNRKNTLMEFAMLYLYVTYLFSLKLVSIVQSLLVKDKQDSLIQFLTILKSLLQQKKKRKQMRNAI